MTIEKATFEEAFKNADTWKGVFEYGKEFLRGRPKGDVEALKSLLDELWDKYVTAEDEESERAKELIIHYATARGDAFKGESEEWGRFMRARPEIAEGLRNYFSKEVDTIRQSGRQSGKLRSPVGPIELKSEAMRLTLHAGTLLIDGEYTTDSDGRIIFSKCRLTWKDRGDLGAGQSTLLNPLFPPIKDLKFIVAESLLRELGYTPGEYDINIHWELTPEEIEAILPGSEKKLKKKMEISPPPKEKRGIRRCGVPCNDFHRYGLCSRRVLIGSRACYQHA